MKIITRCLIISCLFVLVIVGTAAANPEVYTVQEGDTLWQIAHHNGVSVEYLMTINKLSDDKLYIGQEILLGEEQETISDQNTANSSDTTATQTETIYIVQAGDSLWSIAVRHGITLEEIMEMNQLDSDILNPGTILVVPNQISPSRSGASAEAVRLLELAA